ncbi:hypothetical protein [Streptomyces sp. NBC_00063]|uniref:hypothetical protein n=1 Tax=Streptomyces sp. NBC_00063 TaxID=2975638 RepID=UPI003D72F2A2
MQDGVEVVVRVQDPAGRVADAVMGGRSAARNEARSTGAPRAVSVAWPLAWLRPEQDHAVAAGWMSCASWRPTPLLPPAMRMVFMMLQERGGTGGHLWWWS